MGYHRQAKGTWVLSLEYFEAAENSWLGSAIAQSDSAVAVSASGSGSLD